MSGARKTRLVAVTPLRRLAIRQHSAGRQHSVTRGRGDYVAGIADAASVRTEVR
jgi:hypothetical protein